MALARALAALLGLGLAGGAAAQLGAPLGAGDDAPFALEVSRPPGSRPREAAPPADPAPDLGGAAPALAAAAAAPPVDPNYPVKVRATFPPAPAVGERFTVVFEVGTEEGWHTYSPEEETGDGLALVPRPAPGIAWEAPDFPPGKVKTVELLGQKLTSHVYPPRVRVEVAGTLTEAAGRDARLAFDLVYQACSDMTCLLAQDRLLEGTFGAGEVGDVLPDAPVLPVEPPTKAGKSGPTPAPATPADGFGARLEQGLIWALLMAYFWGLAASLSPCVYPMIPVTIAFFGSQQEGEEGRARRTFPLACVYVGGIVLTYALLGVAAARAGRDLGSVMAHPGVLVLVAGVLIALGLSLFGLFELSLPQSMQDRLAGGESRGFGGAFFTGAILGLVAAPCVGPFAASILLFVAQTGDLALGFFALASFGMGMGTLFLALAMGVGSLPRSGMWMVATKKVFGWVLIGVGLWYLEPLVAPEVALLVAGLFCTTGGVMGGAFDPAPDTAGKAARGVTLVLVALGLYLAVAAAARVVPLPGLAAGAAAAPAGGEVAWVKDLAAAKAEAARTGRPLFVDFYADWCIPCKKMEREVFPAPRVRALLAGFVAAKVDCTEPDGPGATEKNKVLKVPAMPYLAIYDPDGTPRPDLSHPGYLGEAEFARLLEAAAAAY